MPRVACRGSGRRFTEWSATFHRQPRRRRPMRPHLLCDSSIRSSERSPNGMSFGLFNPWCEQTQNLKEYVMTGLAFRTQGRIASIVFDRPNEQNLLSRDLLLELRTIATDLASNHEIQVLTLTGEGTECFSTGILTPALRGQLATDQVLNLIRLANETFDAIEA